MIDNKGTDSSLSPTKIASYQNAYKTESNKRTRQIKKKKTYRYKQQFSGYQRARGREVWGIIYMVMEGELTLGSEHTM